jgi:battenin
MRMG